MITIVVGGAIEGQEATARTFEIHKHLIIDESDFIKRMDWTVYSKSQQLVLGTIDPVLFAVIQEWLYTYVHTYICPTCPMKKATCNDDWKLTKLDLAQYVFLYLTCIQLGMSRIATWTVVQMEQRFDDELDAGVMTDWIILPSLAAIYAATDNEEGVFIREWIVEKWMIRHEDFSRMSKPEELARFLPREFLADLIMAQRKQAEEEEAKERKIHNRFAGEYLRRQLIEQKKRLEAKIPQHIRDKALRNKQYLVQRERMLMKKQQEAEEAEENEAALKELKALREEDEREESEERKREESEKCGAGAK